MANKFLGEAGVDVLVNEIKKKIESDKPLFEIYYDKLVVGWYTSNATTLSHAINYIKSIRAVNNFWYNVIHQAEDIFGFNLPIDVFDGKLNEVMQATTSEQFRNLMDEFLAIPIDVFDGLNLRVLLDDNEIFIHALRYSCQTVMWDSVELKLKVRDASNPEVGWVDYSPGATVEEITAAEVTNKFNS